MSLLKLPPHSIEAEKAVLGSIIVKPETLYLTGLAEEDFYRGDHRIIYRAMQACDQRGNPPDLVVLADALESADELEGVGGIRYLSDIATEIPTTDNITSYAEVVKNKSVLRGYIQAAHELSHAAFEGDMDALGKFMSKALPQSGNSQVSLREGLREAIDYIDQASRGPMGIPTGIEKYDSKMGGLHDGNLIIVGGRPSMGKSAVMCNIAVHAGIHKQKSVGVISLEMTRTELIHRMLGIEGMLSIQKMRSGQLEDADWPRLTSAVGQINDKAIHIHEGAGMSIGEVLQVGTAMKHRDQINVLMIDYLQLIKGEGGNRTEQVGHVSRSLKELAKRLKIPVVAMGQVNRDVEKRINKRPTMADLRDSGEIEQDADVIAMCYRDGRYDEDKPDNHFELIVEKNRNGSIGTIHTGWEPELMMIADIPRETYSQWNKEAV